MDKIYKISSIKNRDGSDKTELSDTKRLNRLVSLPQINDRSVIGHSMFIKYEGAIVTSEVKSIDEIDNGYVVITRNSIYKFTEVK